MTGLAGGSEDLYIVGENKDEKKPVIIDAFWPLPLPTNESDVPGMYYFEFDPPQFATRDIACEETGGVKTIWIATGEESDPIKVYEIVMMGTQKLVGSIPAKTGIGRDVYGLVFEKSGSDRFLWVSNQKEKKIYKIDLDAPTEKKFNSAESAFLNSIRIHSTVEGIKIYLPFAGRKEITVTDLQGRTVASGVVPSGENWYRKQISSAAGVLIVDVAFADGTSMRKKILTDW